MKNLIFAFLTIFATSFFLSCGDDTPDDPCLGIECNTGTCESGICKCLGNFTGPNCATCAGNFTGDNCDTCLANFTGDNCDSCISGYEGADCQTPSRDKFIGEYLLTQQACSASSLPDNLELTIVTVANNIAEVSLTFTDGTDTENLQGIVEGNNFSGQKIVTDGEINIDLMWQENLNLVGVYQVIILGVEYNCDVTFEPK